MNHKLENKVKYLASKKDNNLLQNVFARKGFLKANHFNQKNHHKDRKKCQRKY
jgi:hypothetical protein